MGRKSVAGLLEEWLSVPEVKWEASRDVVEWARAYGDDLERAWSECPRADYLMALAGACDAPEEPVVRLVASCAREALRFVPRKEARSTKAVLHAEGYRRGRRFDAMEAKGITEAAHAVLDGLEARSEAAQKARAVLGARLLPAWTRIIGRVVEGTAWERGQAVSEPVRRSLIERAAQALIEAEGSDKELRKWRAAEEGVRDVLRFGHAARAASSAGTVASSADVAIHSLVLLAALTKRGITPENVAGVEEAARLARRGRPRVFTEGALAFAHAADAFGLDAAMSDRAWESAVRVFFTVLVEGVMADEAVDVAAPTQAMKAAVSVFVEDAKEAKLRAWADALRAAVPFSSLRPPGVDEEDVDLQDDPRGAMRRSIERILPALRLLGAPEAIEAGETALAILDAPGPLDVKGLAPVMRTLHERMEGVFRQGAEDAPTEEGRERLQAAVRNAREEAQAIGRFLSKRPPRALD
jgi:hypothetical protein